MVLERLQGVAEAVPVAVIDEERRAAMSDETPCDGPRRHGGFGEFEQVADPGRPAEEAEVRP